MLALRTADGVALDSFRDRHGVDLVASNRKRIEHAAASGLIRVEERRLAPTTHGMAVADALAASFEL
jgi:coproporphyrinogen III oxidase-like Fe-S oxidoreductase